MASRRPVHRKPPNRSLSKVGFQFCLVLAAIALLVPAGSNLALSGKAKVRDLALASGFIDLNDCVVTAEHRIACTSDAVGIPVPAALRQMADAESQAAAEKKQRLETEDTVRTLTAEVERLTAQTTPGQLAGRAETFFPSFAAQLKPTMRTDDTAENNGSIMTPEQPSEQPSTQSSSAATADDAVIPFAFTPPTDADTP
jgi:hypothetical protein